MLKNKEIDIVGGSFSNCIKYEIIFSCHNFYEIEVNTINHSKLQWIL